MKFDVVDTNNRKVGEAELDDSVFGAPIKEHLFWEVVRMQLANRRRGTHATRRVAEVQGSGKKPYKQKGTGQARHGSKRAMNMRGGGVVFGPQPRDYSYRMPKKMVRGALRSALSLRASQQRLFIVQGWSPSAPKTKDAQKVLETFSAPNALVIGDPSNLTLAKSLRNLPKAKFLVMDAMNVFDVLRHDALFISQDVVEALQAKLHAPMSRAEREAQSV
ncbi:MAG: 50S ribosomal protein L4 [Deltaproteobacteria bacterium]|nr:50S ribosomal protein L4 [Deltaproteobacteria bacterium]